MSGYRLMERAGCAVQAAGAAAGIVPPAPARGSRQAPAATAAAASTDGWEVIYTVPGHNGQPEKLCCTAHMQSTKSMAPGADAWACPASPAAPRKGAVATRASSRLRAVSPADAQQQAPGSSRQERGPITPTGAATQAPTSPSAAASSPDAAPSASAAASAAASSRAAAERAAHAAQWRRALSFMRCVAASPVIQSALLSLELGASHPALAEAPPTACGAQWTLAQLLALHLRAGHQEASQESILASLWVLEAVECSWRSPASLCLNDYLKHLAAFSTEAVLELTADWRKSFCALRRRMVDAQMDLLRRLDWRVRLSAPAEVKPCLALLFGLKDNGAAACPAEATRSRELWAAHMHRLCANVQHQARLLSKQARLARHAHEECCEEEYTTPTKRQRTLA